MSDGSDAILITIRDEATLGALFQTVTPTVPKAGDLVRLRFRKTHGGLLRQKWVDQESADYVVSDVVWTYGYEEGYPTNSVSVLVKPTVDARLGKFGASSHDATTLARIQSREGI